MFKSIKEQLITIKNNNGNESYSLIANYLLNCLENNITPTSKKCSQECFVSESVLTAFSKKYGYQGFRELTIRIKVENEYYEGQWSRNYNNTIYNSSNYMESFIKHLEIIENQESSINNLVNIISKSVNVYFLSSYSQISNVELFAAELQLLGYNVFFNQQRKCNPAWLNKACNKDAFVIFAFGLDNQYIVNYYDLAIEKTKNVFLISSNSQKHKFKNYVDNILIDYPDRNNTLEVTRSSTINYLFSKVTYALKSIKN